MGGRNRHIIAALLLVILLAPLSYSFWFQARQIQIRHQMKEALEHAHLQELVLPSASLLWVKPGKEILVNHHLFDIKSIRYRNDGMAVIRGLLDEDETLLVQQLQKDLDQQNRKGSLQIISLFKTVQSLPISGSFQLDSPILSIQTAPVPGSGSLPLVYLYILTPPPQC